MSELDKKPPMKLGEEEVGNKERSREEDITEERRRRRLESEARALDYVDKPPPPRKTSGQGGGGGFSWSTFGASIAVTLAIVAGFIFTMAAGKGDVTQVSNDIGALQGQVAALADTVAVNGGILDNVVNTQGEYAKKSELAGYAKAGTYASSDALSSLRTDFDNLNIGLSNAESPDSLVGLRARVAALETEQEGEEAVAEETVRWTLKDIQLIDAEWVTTPHTNDYSIGIKADTSRIEDEDLYYLNIEIEVDDDGATLSNLKIKDAFIEFVLYPRGDALLDQDDTYVDSDDPPWLDWDADFIIKTRGGADLTKRVVFTSDELGDHGEDVILAGEDLSLDLVLELYYAD